VTVCEELTRDSKTPGRVRITVPISVAFALEKFQTALAGFAQSRGAGCTRPVNVSLPTTRECVEDPASGQVKEAAHPTTGGS
jgi:hypothetical protein